MAIQSVLTNEKLAIRVQSGQDAQGKKIYKDVTFNHLKTPSNPADVYAVAEELRKVMIQPAEGYYVIGRYSLVNDGQ